MHRLKPDRPIRGRKSVSAANRFCKNYVLLGREGLPVNIYFHYLFYLLQANLSHAFVRG
jgi:hypothetical protein